MLTSRIPFYSVFPLILFVVFSFFVINKSAWAGAVLNVVHVAPPPQGNSGNTGGPCDPFDSLQDAVDAVLPGGTIKISEGTFGGDNGSTEISGSGLSGISVWGSFPITQGTCMGNGLCSNSGCGCTTNADCLWPDWDESSRNPVTDATTLEGASPVLVLDDVTGVTISGLIIQNGLAVIADESNCENEVGQTITAGGGIRVEDSANIVLEDLRITTNQSQGAGGGLAICGSTDVKVGFGPFDICTIDANIAQGSDELPGTSDVGGGGVFVWESSDIAFTDCRVTENKGNGQDEDTDADGGGFYILDSSVSMNRLLISGNNAEDGGGIYLNGSFSDILFGVDILDTNIQDNQAENATLLGDSNGGGLACNTSSVQYNRGSIFRNQAEDGDGGGVWCNDCQGCVFYGTNISENTADDHGGGIFAFDDTFLMLEAAKVNDNNAREGDGGGIHITRDTVAQIGPVIFGPDPGQIFEATINNNSAGQGGNLPGAGRGGGIFADNGATIEIGDGLGSDPVDARARTQIIGNRANGGISLDLSFIGGGGGIFVGEGANLTAVDVDILENRSEGDGAGVNFDNIENPFVSNVGDFLRAKISDNQATDAGGGINVGNRIGTSGARITIEDSDILNNIALTDAIDLPCAGGGINFGKGIVPGFTADAIIQNVCIAGNIAGGGPLSANGGGICVTKGADVLVNHATIADNSADGQGGGVFIAIVPSTITLLNSIIRFNDAPTLVQPINTLGIEGRDIWCGIAGANLNLENIIAGAQVNDGGTVFIPPSDVFIGQGCILQINANNKFGPDPFFVNQGVRDYHLRTPFSPAVDMATNAGATTDKEGTPHECAFIGCNQQFAADIGALEFKEFPCTDNCQLPECALTQACVEQRCDDTVDNNADGMVDCNDQDCLTDATCQEGTAFGNCNDGINNNPLQNPFTDCDDPNCSGAAACQPPTPTPTPTATPTPTPTATPTPTPPGPTPTPPAPTPTPTPTPPECEDDLDCPLGEICEDDVCIIGCRDNSDCPAGQTCQNFNDFDIGICLSSGEGGNGCSIAAAAPAHIGTAMANILIPLLPALAIGFRVIRRKKKGQK